MNTLISKILNYEMEIYKIYISKRKKLLKSIKEKKNLNKDQSLIFVNDIKAIIDPIKSSIESIDYYFTNLDLTKKDSINDNKLLFYLLLLDNRFGGASSLDTLDTLDNSSESDKDESSESSR